MIQKNHLYLLPIITALGLLSATIFTRTAARAITPSTDKAHGTGNLILSQPITKLPKNRQQNQDFEVVGHLGGSTTAVFASADHLYAGVGGELSIFDISAPDQPTRLGYIVLPSEVSDIFVDGNHAYVTAGDYGLVVVDVSDQANPMEVGFFDSPNACCVSLAGDYAYLIADFSRLQVVDVSDPSNPTEVKSLDVSGYVLDIAVVGDYAYLAKGVFGLQVVDVSDPFNPVAVGFLATSDIVHDVTVAGEFAYVAESSHGLRVVDVSDPPNPVEVGSLETMDASKVIVAGNYAYVGSFIGLKVVDISDPINPVEVGSLETLRFALDVSIAGNYVYLADGSGLVVDISDPTDPVEVGVFETLDLGTVSVVGGYAYILSSFELQVIDISDPSNPAKVASLETPGFTRGLSVAGNHAYLASNSGLRVADISDPLQPVAVGFLESPGPIYEVIAVGDYAYLDAGFYGLRVADISDPSNPTEVGSLDHVGDLSTVVGDYLYLTDLTDGLIVVDVSNPSNPLEVGSLETSGWVEDVSVVGDYAYLVNGKNAIWADEIGLWVVDISDPNSPVEVGSLVTPFSAGITAAGNYAYLFNRTGLVEVDFRLRVVDISYPTHPTEAGSFYAAGQVSDVIVAEDILYVAAGEGGFYIVRFEPGAESRILGNVTDLAGEPLPGVTISLQDHLSPTQSNEYGAFIFSQLVTGTYSITPTLPGYAFTPTARTVSVPPDAVEQDFTVSSQPVYQIAGQVWEWKVVFPGIQSFDPVSDVPVSLSGGLATTTNLSGTFAFSKLSPGTYTLTPTLKDHILSPPTRTVTIPPDNQEQVFLVSEVPALDIRGSVRQPNGLPFPGVTLTAAPVPTPTSTARLPELFADLPRSEQPLTTTSGLDGSFTFPDLSPGSYAVTPTLPGYHFLPPTQTIDLPTTASLSPFTILPDAATISLTPGLSTTWTVTDTQGLPTQLHFPAGAVPTTTLHLTPTLASLQPGLTSAAHAFDLSAGQGEPLTFTLPVSLTVHHSLSDTRAVSDTAGLTLLWWDGEAWREAGESCSPATSPVHDLDARTFSVPICRTGRFVLYGPTFQVHLPNIER